MVDLNDASVVNLGAVAAGDRFMVQRSGTDRGYIDGSQLTAGSGAAVRRNVTSFPGATFTDQLENAINSGEPWAAPAGRQKLTRAITVTNPSTDGIGAGDGLRMTGGTVFESAAGEDLFRFRFTGSTQSRPGGGNQTSLAHFGISLDPGGANTRNSHERCTTTGYGVGTCGIAFERIGWPTLTTGTGNINDTWNTSHSRIHNITCDVLAASAIDDGCALAHCQGNMYGSRWHDLDGGGGQSSTRRGPDSVLSIAQPYVQKVSCDATTDRITASSGTNNFLNDQRVVIRAHDATGTRPGNIDFDTIYHVVNRTGSNFQIATSQGGAAVNITSNGSGLIYAILVAEAGAVFSPDECYIDRISAYNAKLAVSCCNPERLWLGNLTSYGSDTILEVPGILSTASRTQAVSTTIMNIYSQSPQATAGNANSECVLVESDGLFVGTFQGRGADSGPQPIYRFTGTDHTILNFDGRSSFSQGGVDLRLEAANTFVTGQCHASSTVSVQGDTVGRIRQAGGAGFFFSQGF